MQIIRSLSGALTIAAAALVSMPASAAVVFSQAGNGQACQFSCWTSSLGADASGGFRTYDNFTLATSATITSVNWQGFYDDFITPANNPVSPVTTSWSIGIFANVGGLPGAQLFTITLPAASVTTTLLGVGTFGSQVNVYSITASLGAGFAATAGTTYFFSPLSNQPDLNPIFSWSSDAINTGTSAQSTFAGTTSGPAAGAVSLPNDRAFTLSSTDAVVTGVPEPESIALLGLGFVALAVARRRRVR
jgi:hypothetical protein